MIVSVMKTTFQKLKPNVVYCKDYTKLSTENYSSAFFCELDQIEFGNNVFFSGFLWQTIFKIFQI